MKHKPIFCFIWQHVDRIRCMIGLMLFIPHGQKQDPLQLLFDIHYKGFIHYWGEVGRLMFDLTCLLGLTETVLTLVWMRSSNRPPYPKNMNLCVWLSSNQGEIWRPNKLSAKSQHVLTHSSYTGKEWTNIYHLFILFLEWFRPESFYRIW